MEEKLHPLDKEREELIQYIKSNSSETTIPPTTEIFYKIDRKIGSGAFGKVMLGYHILTGQKVAIKQINKKTIVDEY